MRRGLSRRLAALALVAVMVAPSAGAVPAKLGRLDLVSVWASAWGWVTSLWAKEGPDVHPWRRPGHQTDVGPGIDPWG